MADVLKASTKKSSKTKKARVRYKKPEGDEVKIKCYLTPDATIQDIINLVAEQTHISAIKLQVADPRDGSVLNPTDSADMRVRLWRALNVKKPYFAVHPAAITSTAAVPPPTAPATPTTAPSTAPPSATGVAASHLSDIQTHLAHVGTQLHAGIHAGVQKVQDKITTLMPSVGSSGPISGKMKISIIQGRNLVARDINGFSDPYVILTAFDANLKQLGKAHHTEVVSKTLNPKWKPNDDVTEQLTGFTFIAWDDDGVLKADDFLGTFNVAVNTIPRNTVVEHWFPVHKTERYPAPITGELQVRFFFETTLPGGPDPRQFLPRSLSMQQITLLDEQRAARASTDQSTTTSAGHLKVRCTLRPPKGPWEGSLYVTVVEGIKLDAKDFNGLSDPYVILEFNGKTCQTSVKKKTLYPTFNESFRFYISAHDAEVGVVAITLKDWDIVGGDDLIGTCAIVLADLPHDKEHEQTLDVRVKFEQTLPKKIGESMRKSGYEPHLPILIIPGLASSSLVVKATAEEGWANERVWLSLGRLGSQKFERITAGIRKGLFLRSTPSQKEEELSAADKVFRSQWISHLLLEGDLCSDPKGVQVRALPGKVMGPLIENLHDVGYNDTNLAACPYDWRIPPQLLEERDHYFSDLKTAIAKMVQDNKKPVVVLCHSMGNRVFQYFLNWVVKNDPNGKVWLDSHVHTFLAVGAPFLGAPKTVRGLITGERMGLDTFLTEDDGIAFCRSLASMPLLYPMALRNYFSEPPRLHTPTAFVYYDAEGTGKEPTTMQIRAALSMAGAVQQVLWIDKYYQQNPLFGGGEGDEFILKAPPVQRLYAIYGVNLETEFAYFFRHSKSRNRPVIDADRKNPRWEGFFYENGIAYETEKTWQPILEIVQGCSGKRSGDGTVPYASLAYCYHWKKDLPNLRVEELDKVEHRGILNNRDFFQRLINYVARQERPAEVDDDTGKSSPDEAIGDVDVDFAKLNIRPSASD